MVVYVTGATGFVGRALVARLLGNGDRVLAEVRSKERARCLLGSEVELVDGTDGVAVESALARSEAVVNLAGENLFAGRWTTARKRRLVESRVDRTRRLVEAIGRAPARPKVLVSASAVGIYGDSGEAADESTTPGPDFLARLCSDWEAAAAGAKAHGLRVVPIRIGLVFGRGGGALERLGPLFSYGLGGRLGSGNQPVPFIDLDDLVGILRAAIADRRYDGAVNAVAPECRSNREMTRFLADAVGRPAPFPAPAPILRLALGEAAGVLLGGREVKAKRLSELGYRFASPEMGATLRRILRPEVEIGRAPRESGATYLLRTTSTIDAPIERVFDFFSHPGNLGVITPAAMSFEVLGGAPGEISEGVKLDYRIRIAGFPVGWTSVISTFEPGSRFVDEQLRGPYRFWLHEHAFEADGPGRTKVIDRVLYTPPAGPLGRIAHALAIGGMLRTIFGYRADAIRRLFPSVSD